MYRLVSTLVIALRCIYCGKYLKQTEAYYLYNECSECKHHHDKERYENRMSERPNF